MRLRLSSGEIALTLGLVVAVLLGPLVLRGDPVERARLENNARLIQEMTAAERARLDRNYRRWEAMSPAERQNWRTFVNRLEVDRQTNHGRLNQALEDYYHWLQTIPGYRRDQLRETRDVSQRTALVAQIAAEERAQRLDAPPADPRLFGRWEGPPTLNREELANFMTVLEGTLLPAEQQALIGKDGNELQGFERYLITLFTLRKRYQRPVDLVQRPDVRDKLLKALPEDLQEGLTRGVDRTSRELSFRLMAMLMLSLRQEIERFMAELKPSPDQLRKFFMEHVAQADQEQLCDLPSDEFKRELEDRYFRAELQKRVDIGYDQLQRMLASDEFRVGGNPPNGLRPPEQRDFPRLLPRGPFERGVRAPPPDEGEPRRFDERRRPDGEPPERGEFRPPPGEPPPPGERPNEIRPRDDRPDGERPPGDRQAGERPPSRESPPPGERPREGAGPPPRRGADL